MLDILFFVVVAFFIFKKLIQAFGDTKYDREGGGPFSNFSSNIASFVEKTAQKTLSQIDMASALEASMTEEQRKVFDEIRQYDPNFLADKFVNNAKAAFKIILESFAKGEKSTLENLVIPEIYKNFMQQIEHRVNQGQDLDLTIVAIRDAVITDVFKKDLEVYIDVQITSEQIKAIKDKVSGEIINGNTSKLLVVKDNWRFVRQVNSSSKVWRLAKIIDAARNE